MSDTFSHYADPVEVINDGNRLLHVSLGDVGGLELAHLGLESSGKRVDALLTLPETRDLVKSLQAIDPAHQPHSGGYYLYRVVITKYPDGSLFYYTDGDEEFGQIDPNWEPEGWSPDEYWVAHHGSKFFWPSTKREYRSKSSAQSRARLIESFGAFTTIQRSSLITWPE